MKIQNLNQKQTRDAPPSNSCMKVTQTNSHGTCLSREQQILEDSETGTLKGKDELFSLNVSFLSLL